MFSDFSSRVPSKGGQAQRFSVIGIGMVFWYNENMEIKNKEYFKAELKKEITKHVRQFPLFFYGNIVINFLILAVILATISFIILSLAMEPAVHLIVYGAFLIVSLGSIFSITIRDFFKNIRILNALRENNYEAGIEEYELDNIVEFIEQLPMSKEEIEDMRKELSFDKIFDMLELFSIISCEKGIYDLDIVFKYEAEGELES